jgi:hypothetical protein
MPPPLKLVNMWQEGQAASRDTSSSFSANTFVLSQIAVLNGCFAVVREMEPRAEHSSVRFKQRAVIEFLTAEGNSPTYASCLR